MLKKQKGRIKIVTRKIKKGSINFLPFSFQLFWGIKPVFDHHQIHSIYW